MTTSRHILIAALSTASTLASPALSQTANPFTAAITPAPVPAFAPSLGTSPTLRNFPMGEKGLFLTGERASRELPFYVTAQETARPARLVVAYKSAVSVMPETSTIKVLVNEVAVGEAHLGSGEAERLEVMLPTGLLQPGFNAVRLLVEQHHRVDCGIDGTYELWTQIDPQASGLDFTLGAVPPADLAELPSFLRVGEDRAPINLVVEENRDPAVLGKAMALAQAVGILGRLPNAAVTISASRGTGAGLDVIMTDSVVGTGPMLLDGRPIDGVALAAPDQSGRATLTVGRGASGNVDATIEQFVAAVEAARPQGTPAGLDALDAAIPLATNTPVRLSDLGLDTEEFAGRFYRSTISFDLPADFYPADYDAARITLDAAFAGGLDSDAMLIGSANGRQAFTLPLSAPTVGQIERQNLKIPLSALRPGRNTIELAARLTKPSDAACDPATIGELEPRFLIAPTSTLTLPTLARIGHIPDIASFTIGSSGEDPADAPALTILAPSLSSAEINSAASLVSRIAAGSGTVRPVQVTPSLPEGTSGDILAVGTFASLPAEILSAVGVASPAFASSALGVPGVAEADMAEAGGPAAKLADVQLASFADAFGSAPDVVARLEELSASIASAVPDGILSIAGAYQSAFSGPVNVAASEDTKLILAQTKAPVGETSALTVVAASEDEMLQSGVEALTEPAVWNRIGGAASVLDTENAVTVHAAASEHLFETQPRSFSNLRLILAGWLSRHLEVYVVMLLALALSLGLATRFFLSQIGTRGR